MGTSNAQTENEHDRGNVEANPVGTSIEAFFAASVILVTGATGFVGKALVEKLLRACPRIATIYCIIRPGKNQSVEERLQTLFNNSVFDRIREECPEALNKVVPIMGDVSKPNLGLSDADILRLTQEVNFVIHSAATVRFDERLKVAILLNTRGTQRIIELCSKMINLVSFVHVSTAYSNADKKEINETIYNTKITPMMAMEMADHLDDDVLNSLEPKLIGDHPNTYTMTKGLAERLLFENNAAFPACIVRPCIIGAAYQEPYPGWVDNISGVTGIIMELARGRLRVLKCGKETYAEVIPVDYVVDSIICAAWHNVMRRSNSLKIYNVVCSADNPLYWGAFGRYVQKHAVALPTEHAIWYPGHFMTTNKYLHRFSTVLLHMFPAILTDIVLKLRGSKAIMWKMAKKYERIAGSGSFFVTHDWKFNCDNVHELIKLVETANDAKNFNINIKTMDWDTYISRYVLGIRQHLFKDRPNNMATAKNRILMFYWIQKFIQIFAFFALYRIVVSI